MAIADASASADAQPQHPLRALVLLSVGHFLLAAAAYGLAIDWSPEIPRDGTSLVVGRDFLNFWMYGRAAGTDDPSRFYDLAIYNAELARILGDGYLWNNWSYPPSIMLFAVAFGKVGYFPALLIWTVLSLGVFLVTVGRQARDWRVLVALALSPAAILGLMSGQSALLLAAIITSVFAMLDRRPILAGVLIGLLTLKPQLGILFPVMLVAAGRWCTFAAATLTTLALVAVTAGVFGWQVWIDYANEGIPTQNLVLSDPRTIVAPFMPTLFMNLRGTGIDYSLAMAAQGCVTVAAACAVFWAFRWRRDAEPRILAAFFLACSVSAIPYMLSYDTLAFTVAALLLTGLGSARIGWRPILLVYWLPALQLVFGSFHIPGPALVAPFFAFYLYRRSLAGPRFGKAIAAASP